MPTTTRRTSLAARAVAALPLVAAGLLAITGSLAAGAVASSAPINYGNFIGVDVMFLNVTEDSATDPTPLYGPPTVSGNGLSFTPLAAFSALSSGGGAPDITDGKLTTVIMAKPGLSILAVNMSESGDYTLQGTGTIASQVAVSAPIFLTLLEVNGIAVTPQPLFAGNMAMTPSGGTFDLVNDPGIGVTWSGSLSIDVNALAPGATKVALAMNNTLVALSETGSIAFIAKKSIEGPNIDVVVPEPSSMALVGLGFLGLAWVAARRAV